jgi:protease I
MAKVAMILGPEFEDAEFRVPYDRLAKSGHEVTVIGTSAGQEMGGKRGKEKVRAEAAANDRDPTEFDALVLPGGHGPDNIRTDEAVVSFIRRFVDTGKPVAAVCHGPQLLIEADAVRGKRMTSWPSVKKDLMNAGADWVDEEVVEDGSLITSRNPDDLEAFSTAILERL